MTHDTWLCISVFWYVCECKEFTFVDAVASLALGHDCHSFTNQSSAKEYLKSEKLSEIEKIRKRIGKE